MDWIVVDVVAIGNAREAANPDVLRAGGFASVLSLIEATLSEEEVEAAGLGEVELEVVPLIDGPGNETGRFRRACDVLVDLAAQARPVLVPCHAGRSRSVAVVAAFLARQHGLTAEEAPRRVASRREAAVTPALIALLRESLSELA